MKLMYGIGLAASMLTVGSQGLVAQTPEAPAPLDPPALEAPAPGSARVTVTPGRDDTPAAVEPDQTAPPRSRSEVERVYVTKSPPAPIVERPSGRRPSARAIWVGGNWEWDPTRLDFVWVPGSWQVVAKGTNWVGGRWQRDDRGWFWTQGFWGRRRDNAVAVEVAVPTVLSRRPTWRIEGPPAQHPADVVVVAPGPDYFHIPGHYRPNGQVVLWKPGAWAREQPGWEWVTARWIRRPDGWDYRPGFWTRDPGTTASVANRSQPRSVYSTTRSIDSNVAPATADPDRANAPANTDAPPPPPLGEDDSDPVTAMDRDVPIIPEVPVAVEPNTGMPYYMIRPPGAYPYGRNGVVVPGAVPPFVRNLLDRVLP
jgi:hypothetical protein